MTPSKRYLVCFLAWLSIASGQKLAIEAETLYTSGPQGKLTPGTILINDGKITAVGRNLRIPDGYTRLRAKVATPGLVDAHSTIGLSGVFNVPADQDQDEESEPNQAELRALDGFNPNEALLDFALENGVTTLQAAPGRRNVIAGQAAIFKTRAKTRTVDGMVVRPVSAMFFTLGEAPKELYAPKGKAPTTRMGSAAMIRAALTAAQNYERRKGAERDLKLEALARVLRREIPAVFSAHREDDILTALRIGREFNLDVILDGATEGYLVAAEIVKAGVPVVVSPTMIRASSLETRNATLENAAMLANAGVRIAIQSGFEGYVPKTRLALFEASVAAANGLGLDRALAAVTVDAARILGIADRVGSLEEGKDADVALFSGDPFEYVTRVEAVVSGGQAIHPKQ